MKVLILSCSTGEGHNSAAAAVRAAFDSRGIEYEQRDPVSFRSDRATEIVNATYNNIIKKAPGVFGVIYKAGEIVDNSRLKSPIYKTNAVLAEPIYNYARKNGFDAILSTHLFGMEACTAIRYELGREIPSFGVLTDYTMVPFFDDCRLDCFFTPHEALTKDLVAAGIPEETVRPTGIPVAPKFSRHIPKAEAREKLGLDQNKKIFVVMSGGVGGGNVTGICSELMRVLGSDSKVYVMTGHNDDLRAKLENEYAANDRIATVPFTKEVNVWFNAADILLSKAGGLSSTEAAVANIPLIHVGAIPGCETANAEFFEARGMSINTKDEFEAAKADLELSRSPERQQKMIECQRREINPDAAGKIADFVKSFI